MLRCISPPSPRLLAEFFLDLAGVLTGDRGADSGSAKETVGPASPSLTLVSGTTALENLIDDPCRDKAGRSSLGGTEAGLSALSAELIRISVPRGVLAGVGSGSTLVVCVLMNGSSPLSLLELAAWAAAMVPYVGCCTLVGALELFVLSISVP